MKTPEQLEDELYAELKNIDSKGRMVDNFNTVISAIAAITAVCIIDQPVEWNSTVMIVVYVEMIICIIGMSIFELLGRKYKKTKAQYKKKLESMYYEYINEAKKWYVTAATKKIKNCPKEEVNRYASMADKYLKTAARIAEQNNLDI